MKKLILIPSLAIASTLPLLCSVSCATTRKWKLSDGRIEWTHDLASGRVRNKTEATNKYFNEIDKDLFADDMLKSLSETILEQEIKPLDASIKVSVKKINNDEHRLTWSIEMTQIKQGSWGTTNNAKISCNFYNFPMQVYLLYLREPTNVVWSIGAINDINNKNENEMPEYYANDKEWSFSFDVIADGVRMKDTIDCTANNDPASHSEAFKFCFYERYQSYYFPNVKYDPQ